MAASPAAGSFEFLCLEALKALGKALSQMNLYRIGHPTVAATIEQSHALLQQLLAQVQSELAFSIDQEKLIANGRVVGASSQLPSSITQFFTRHRLSSVSFKPGLPVSELSALCEMAALRPEQAKAVDPAAFLAERQLTHISLNEAIYAKVGQQPEAPLPAERPAAAAAPSGEAQKLAERLENATLEQTIDALVKASAVDPQDQGRLTELVLQRIRQELEDKVRQATEGLRREKTQIENEQIRTQTVLTQMAEGVVVVDEQGKVLMMNPAAEEIYGKRLAEAAGKPLADNVKEEHLMALAAEINAPQDRPINQEVSVMSTDETKRTLRASAAVVQNEAGKTVGLVSVLPDITKQKELARVEREFVAHVTHELRAPLSAIRAALELLQGQFQGKLSPDDERMFNTALRNSDRLADLIRDILDFGKIESGQMSVRPEPVAPERIAREAVESLQPWSQKKGISLTLDAPPNLPPIHADIRRTVQVLVNLLSNAIKFTPKGGKISVRLEPKARERLVQFSVTDTGPGIAKEDQEKIFQKFVQIAAGEKHVGGTGLGLAIAKALIHMQKGQMWVVSDLGRGSSFLFTLPFHTPPADVPIPKAAASRPSPWWKKLLGIR